MKLSDVSQVANIHVERDGEFASLGLLSHTADRMLVMLYDEKYLDRLMANAAIACVIATPELATKLPPALAVATSDNPMAAFYRVHQHLMDETNFYWDDFETEISPQASVHETAWVAPRNVRIGRGSVVGPKVVVTERVLVGEDVRIDAGVILGGSGFEPKHVGDRHIIVPHAGAVRIGDRVAILAGSQVCWSVFGGFTEVGEETLIDAKVLVTHNARVGRRCELAAGALVAGSATVGDDVWIGPHATVSSEVTVGDRAFVAIGSVVIKPVEADVRVFGVPARPIPTIK